jgi:putative flippase GtrA
MSLRTPRQRLHQPVAFLAVGLASAAIDAGVFLALHSLGMPPAAASAAGFLSAFAVNYRGNRDLVFDFGRAPGALSRYAILVAINLGLSSAGVWLLVGSGLLPWAAKLTTMVMVAAINFVTMRLWVFAPSTNVQPAETDPGAGPPAR